MDGGTVGSQVVLEETFYIISKKNTVFKVKLSEKGLVLEKDANGNIDTETIRITDIIGARCMRSRRNYSSKSCVCGPKAKKHDLKGVEDVISDQDENDVSAYLYIYCYILKKCRLKSGERRDRMTITLRFRSFDRFEDNMREAERWRTAIRCLISKRPIPGSVRLQEVQGVVVSPAIIRDDTRPLLILLNPKSGQGRGREVFQSRVAPVLTEADMTYDLHVTKYANYARDFVRMRDIFQWRSIVVVGGDGILFEVLNGIFEREDWRKVLSELSLGIIPCGSGNGLAKALSHTCGEPYESNPCLISALNVISRNIRLMDVVRVETSKETIFSFLSIGWGLIADIDIESEKLRAIGSPRFSIWSIARLLGLRTYKGKLMFQKAENAERRGGDLGTLSRTLSDGNVLDEKIVTIPNSHSLDDVLDGAEVLSLDTVGSGAISPSRERVDSFYSVHSRHSAYYSMAGSSYRSADSSGGESPRGDKVVRMFGPPSELPSLTQPVPTEWETIEGDFVMVHATYQSHIGSDCYMAPEAKMDDGIIWLLIVRGGATRSQLLHILMGLSTGTHVSSPQLQIIPVTAFRLEPDGVTGHMTVDGESVHYGPIQAEIIPQAVKMMCR